MRRVALIALAHGVTSTTVDLSQDWVVNTDAKAEAALDAVVEEDIGQLMLQGGDDLVDAAWISDTFTDASGNSGSEGGYGYRWWLPPPSLTGGATCWLALGADVLARLVDPAT